MAFWPRSARERKLELLIEATRAANRDDLLRAVRCLLDARKLRAFVPIAAGIEASCCLRFGAWELGVKISNLGLQEFQDECAIIEAAWGIHGPNALAVGKVSAADLARWRYEHSSWLHRLAAIAALRAGNWDRACYHSSVLIQGDDRYLNGREVRGVVLNKWSMPTTIVANRARRLVALLGARNQAALHEGQYLQLDVRRLPLSASLVGLEALSGALSQDYEFLCMAGHSERREMDEIFSPLGPLGLDAGVSQVAQVVTAWSSRDLRGVTHISL
jgi:hypothetical protein